MRHFIALNLRRRLILLLLAVFVLQGAVLVWHAVAQHRERIDSAEASLVAKTRLLAAQQHTIVAHADLILSGLSRLPEIRSGSTTAACSKVFAARLAGEDEFINFGVALANGDVACSAVPTDNTVNLADREWFQQALKSEKMVIGDVSTGRVSNERLITFAKAIQDTQGDVSGVVFTGLDLSWLQRDIAKSKLRDGAHLLVVDGKGGVAAHYHESNGSPDARVRPSIPIKSLLAQDDEEITEVVDAKGARVLFSHSPLFATTSGTAQLWLGVPMLKVLASAKRDAAIGFTGMLTALIVAMAVLLWNFDRFMVQPLRNLAETAKRFGAGDFTARVGSPTIDTEIGRLAQSFNEMAATIAGNEKRFQTAAEASLDAQFLLTSVRGRDGGILDFAFSYINARAEDMLGMARQKVIGKNLCELMPINRSGGFFDRYVAVVETGVPLEEEFPIDTPEIEAKWLRHQVVRLGDGVAISARDITIWKELTREQRRLAVQNETILNAAGEGIFGLNREGLITFINPSAAAMLQRTRREMLDTNMHALVDHSRDDGTPYSVEECPVCMVYRDGVVRCREGDTFQRKDGTRFPVEFMSTPIRDDRDEPVGAVVSFSDITARQTKDRTLARATRALKTLTQVNHALVRETDEAKLLNAACRVIVETGGYRMAWVGFSEDNPERSITPIAWAGIAEDDLASLDFTWADTEPGQSPTGRAIRGGEPVVTSDIATDPPFAPRRQGAMENGYAANFVIPLTIEGKVFGAIGIYAAEADAFDTSNSNYGDIKGIPTALKM